MNTLRAIMDGIDLITARLRTPFKALVALALAYQGGVVSGAIQPIPGTFGKTLNLMATLVALYTLREGQAKALVSVKTDEAVVAVKDALRTANDVTTSLRGPGGVVAWAGVFAFARGLGLLLCLVFLGTVAGCKTTGSTPPGPISTEAGQVAVDCGAPAIHDLAAHLVDDVASALITTGDWHAALAAVAVRAGNDGLAAVQCAVAEVLSRTSLQLEARASMDKDTGDRIQLMHDRALEYLTGKKTVAAVVRTFPSSYDFTGSGVLHGVSTDLPRVATNVFFAADAGCAGTL